MTIQAEAAFADLLKTVDVMLSARAERDAADRSRMVAGLVAHLAGEMTELVARREREAARFLLWLENHARCSVASLRGRETIERYYEQAGGAGAILRILEDNHPRRVGTNLKPPRAYGAVNPARDAVIGGFEESMKVLAPLLSRIALTDRLIDLLVYRLYRLTPEETEYVDRVTAADAGAGVART